MKKILLLLIFLISIFCCSAQPGACVKTIDGLGNDITICSPTNLGFQSCLRKYDGRFLNIKESENIFNQLMKFAFVHQ